MQTVIQRKRVFVSGRLVEYWEHPDIPFGWSRKDLHGYAERGNWVLLFNAILLTAPRPAIAYAS